MRPTAIFDLDGTLVHSAPDIHAALNRVLARRALAPYGLAEVQAMIGDGAKVLLDRALAGRGAPFQPDALAEFVADDDLAGGGLTRPYPGVADMLTALAEAGWQLAVCTNKPSGPARSLLAALGLLDRFAAVGGGDSFPARKPSPVHVLGTLALAGGEPGRAVMIGDHANDVLAATAANLPCVFVAWGYGAPATMAGAAAVAVAPGQLPDILPRLIGLTPNPDSPYAAALPGMGA